MYTVKSLIVNAGIFFVEVWPPNLNYIFLVCTNYDYTELEELIWALSLNSGQATIQGRPLIETLRYM